MSYSNKAIVEGLKTGKEEFLHLLYDQFSSILEAYAKNTVRNPLLAEDFVQDAFCTLWENRLKLNPEQPVQSYLYRLVHNKCVDFIRKQQAHSKYSKRNELKLMEIELTQHPFENIIISEITANEAHSIFQETIQNLPEQTREIFQMSRYLQLSNNQIAEKKGLSVKAIEYHITKALQQLKNSLQEFL